jgi:hypothetical protein
MTSLRVLLIGRGLQAAGTLLSRLEKTGMPLPERELGCEA